MSSLVLEVRDGNDPLGTPLGVLTAARMKRLLVEDDGVGSGSFVINRHHPEAELCERGNYVAVYAGVATGDLDDALGAFWIEGGTDVVLTPRGRGGEDMAREGRGPLAYTAEAEVWHRAKTGNRRARRAAQPARRRWHWRRVHPGAVLRRLLAEAKARNGLPDLSWDFTKALDSDGQPWQEDEAQRMNVPIGPNLLETIDLLRDTGLYVLATPGLVVRAWDSHGSDLSATIGFTAGVDIREEVIRQLAAARARSHILVEGENRKGRTRFRAIGDSDIRAELGRRKEGFYRVERTATRRVLRRVGRKRLRRWKREYDQPIGLPVLDSPGKVALVDYFPGDTIALTIPDSYEQAGIRVASIALVQSEAVADYHPVLELGAFLVDVVGDRRGPRR